VLTLTGRGYGVRTVNLLCILSELVTGTVFLYVCAGAELSDH
jgi:hypothetical protein